MTLQQAIEQGFARAVVRLAQADMGRLMAVQASIAAASGFDGPGPGKADVLEACRLRHRLQTLAAMAEAFGENG